MKKIYKILSIGLAIISILCLFNDLELISIPGFIGYTVCLNRSVK